MSVLWLCYALGISVLLLFAAHATEAVLRLLRLPARFAWAGALLGSLALPIVLPLLPAAETEPALWPVSFVIPLDVVAGNGAAAFWSSTQLVVAGWVLVSAAVFALGLRSFMRLHRARSRWRSEQIDGTDVLLSTGVGPAVIGVVRPRAVLPEWVLHLSAEERRLVLLHEAEHIRARDPLLLLFGALTVVAAPWNLALWYQWMRLRRAVEVDCDHRVLRQGVTVRPYASLLLDVGERVSGVLLPVAAFAEQKSLLETRIQAMTARAPRYRVARTFAWAGAAVALIIVACDAPIPGEPLRKENESALTAARSTAPNEPYFTPYTAAPQLVNPEEMRGAMQRHYPPLLRDAGIGGVVLLWAHIGADGAIRDLRVKTGSGHLALDDAAIRVMQNARFTPARNQGTPVNVWVEIPVQFVDTGAASQAQATAAPTRKVRINPDLPDTN